MTVIFATLHGVNGFARTFDMGRSMGDCFREVYATLLNGRLWPNAAGSRIDPIERTRCWSTAGTTLRSTQSRPVKNQRRYNIVVLVGFPPSEETITSNIWRRIPMAIAGLEGVECPSKSRSWRWGRRRSRSYTEGSGRKSHGYRRPD